MSNPKIPIARIRNDYARRAAMFVVFPLMIVWAFNWRLIVLPMAIACNAGEAAWEAIKDSIREDFSGRAIRLVVAAWRAMWAEPLG